MGGRAAPRVLAVRFGSIREAKASSDSCFFFFNFIFSNNCSSLTDISVNGNAKTRLQHRERSVPAPLEFAATSKTRDAGGEPGKLGPKQSLRGTSQSKRVFTETTATKLSSFCLSDDGSKFYEAF